LNNAAGSNRSNVAWGDNNTTWSIGDNFTLTGSSYAVDSLRVWVVSSSDLTGSQNAFELRFGTDAGAATTVSPLASSTSVSLVTYADSSTYQGSSGSFLYLYQVDFSNLNLTLAAGTYAFGVAGPAGADGLNTPFLHASNEALSGSTQDGSDGLVYGFTAAGAMDTGWGYPFNSCCGNGWDKNSDVNVQVYGAPVPLPAAAWLLISGLGGLGFLGRRKTA
jgi:hypothetical protein